MVMCMGILQILLTRLKSKPLDNGGILLSSFQAETIAGAMAFDVRTVVGVNDFNLFDMSQLVGEYDLMGRIWSNGNKGVKTERMSDGTNRVVYIAE